MKKLFMVNETNIIKIVILDRRIDKNYTYKKAKKGFYGFGKRREGFYKPYRYIGMDTVDNEHLVIDGNLYHKAHAKVYLLGDEEIYGDFDTFEDAEIWVLENFGETKLIRIVK